MAKQGLTLNKLNGCIRKDEQWALCIGAGTSLPLLPSWNKLIDKLIEKLKLPEIKTNGFIKDGFSLDAIIQAIKERADITDKGFLDTLSEIVYSPIKEQLSEKEIVAFNTVHDFSLGYASKNTKDREARWGLFCKFRDQVFGETTAYGMAKIMAQGFDKGIKPSAILTFNGEACFLALLNSFLFENHNNTIPEDFDRVVNILSDRKSKNIPYYHCHGIIPNKISIYKEGFNANEKLVFSEDSYLQLANSNFSWQSSSFISTCIHNRVIFVGVSLTDSNMRRWLSWIHNAKMSEMELNALGVEDDENKDNGAVKKSIEEDNNKKKNKESTEHFWIKVKPQKDDWKKWYENPKSIQNWDEALVSIQKWYENLVSILGVRIIWIDEWSEVPKAMGIILGIIDPEKTNSNKAKKTNRKSIKSTHVKQKNKRTQKNHNEI